jgi:glyoxylase-like metal-dependent hydrolase (beta-lactamase superfamily II)
LQQTQPAEAQQTAAPDIRAYFDEATSSVSYLVADPTTATAAIIDPVLDFDLASGRVETRSADVILADAEQRGLTIAWLLETHPHADHLSAAAHLKERTGAPVAIGAGIVEVQGHFGALFDSAAGGGDFDRLLEDGERLPLGSLEIQVLATPGHTPACISYRIGDAVFVGDTLFMPDYGTARADFPGGDARQLYRSIRRLLSLPRETRLYLCHDYKAPGREAYAWETTVGEESDRNLHVGGGISEEDYVAMRTSRDATLCAPKLLYPAIQVNIRAGKLPEPSANGQRFLKLPLSF